MAKMKSGKSKRYKANLKSIRSAIDRVIAHVASGKKHAGRKAANRKSKSRANQLLKSLKRAKMMMASECCNDDQDCPFDVI